MGKAAVPVLLLALGFGLPLVHFCISISAAKPLLARALASNAFRLTDFHDSFGVCGSVETRTRKKVRFFQWRHSIYIDGDLGFVDTAASSDAQPTAGRVRTCFEGESGGAASVFGIDRAIALGVQKLL